MCCIHWYCVCTLVCCLCCLRCCEPLLSLRHCSRLSRLDVTPSATVQQSHVENIRLTLIRTLNFTQPLPLLCLRRLRLKECGVALEDFNDFKEGDVLQCYKLDEVKRQL